MHVQWIFACGSLKFSINNETEITRHIVQPDFDLQWDLMQLYLTDHVMINLNPCEDLFCTFLDSSMSLLSLLCAFMFLLNGLLRFFQGIKRWGVGKKKQKRT